MIGYRFQFKLMRTLIWWSPAVCDIQLGALVRIQAILILHNSDMYITLYRSTQELILAQLDTCQRLVLAPSAVAMVTGSELLAKMFKRIYSNNANYLLTKVQTTSAYSSELQHLTMHWETPVYEDTVSRSLTRNYCIIIKLRFNLMSNLCNRTVWTLKIPILQYLYILSIWS